jgi:ankyrin repeat protein
MSIPMAEPRSLQQVLAGTSEFLFPGELGERVITHHSRSADGDTPLHVLAWQNDVEGVRMLITAGADVNALGDMGYTPLHVAVAQGNAPMAALLLQAGARSDLATEIGGTARDEALRQGGQVGALFAHPDA